MPDLAMISPTSEANLEYVGSPPKLDAQKTQILC